MPIKNYTTEVPASRSVQEIQLMLQNHGVNGVLMEYEQGTGRIESVAFRININERMWSFRLPLRWRQAYEALYRHSKQGERFVKGREEQAYRVAWRILRDWVSVQMALVELEVVQLQEVFLPYVVQKDGRTLFENIADNPSLLLGSGKEAA